MISKIYDIIWYHFQWFVENKALRRPFTYWMRDARHKWPWLFWPVTLGIFYGVWILGRWNYPVGYVTAICCGIIFGHLFWGTPYKPGEQESPEIILEGERK